jgi:hypothetical protein
LNDDVRASTPMLISDARSWYDAFETQVQKRYSRGLPFQVAYTYSKSLNEGDTQGVFRRRCAAPVGGELDLRPAVR